MTKSGTAGKIKRANERRQRRENTSEVESAADNENYSGILTIVIAIAILSGFLLYKWFVAMTATASLGSVLFLLVSGAFIVVLSLAVFALSGFLLQGQLLSSRRLARVLYFGSIVGVSTGVGIAILTN